METINEIYPSGTRLYSRLIPGKVLSPGTFSQYFSSTVFSPFTSKPAASLLTLFRSERNEGMNWKACFEKVLIYHSGMPLELLPARRLSLLRCTRRPCVSGNFLERWHVLRAGPGSGASGWARKHAGIMTDLKGEIWFHGLPLKREIKAGMEETGGIRKEHVFKYLWYLSGLDYFFISLLKFYMLSPVYLLSLTHPAIASQQ